MNKILNGINENFKFKKILSDKKKIIAIWLHISLIKHKSCMVPCSTNTFIKTHGKLLFKVLKYTKRQIFWLYQSFYGKMTSLNVLGLYIFITSPNNIYKISINIIKKTILNL